MRFQTVPRQMGTGMKILNRLYSDYFMPSRLAEYERIIVTAKEQNYVHLTIPEFYDKRESGIDAEKKYFIHRHDIDTDPLTARRMFEIEKKYGVRTSYYFRLSTLDVPLMREIHEFGSEVGYHYEELAQFCKDKRIRSPEKARGNFEQVREIFRANFRAISERAGFPVTTIASHGDFVNRKLGITNSAFITRELMDELGIRFECYDAELLEKFGTIIDRKSTRLNSSHIPLSR